MAGPGRRKLKVKDPEHYHWRPKELLANICAIYVHLGRADTQGVFASAIAADGRCYRPEMFPEAGQVAADLKAACSAWGLHAAAVADAAC